MIITETKTCSYWSCQRGLRGHNFLCSDHHKTYQDGLIDKCPGCGGYKDKEYELCLACRKKRHAAAKQKTPSSGNGKDKKRKYKEEHSKVWEKADEGVERFFAYILKLDNGEFYVGHTRELRERLSEHRDDKTISTAGRNPRLQYFEVLPTRESAKLREVELKKIRDSNPRQIRRMILSFQDLLREVNCD